MNASFDNAQVDAAAALPKKANWDLKRDNESRMARLDRQTQRAISELVRERVRAQQTSSTSGSTGPAAPSMPSAGVNPPIAARGGAKERLDSADADVQFDFDAAGLNPNELVRAVAGVEAAIASEVGGGEG